MRRATVFAALVLPLLAWTALRVWVDSRMDEWLASAADLSLTTRLLIFVDNWAVRHLPFAVVPFVYVSPILALGIAAVAGSFSRHSSASAVVVLGWCCGAVGLGAGAFLLDGDNLALPLLLAWAAFVSYALSLGSAFSLQRWRVTRKLSRVHAHWVLLVSVVIHYVLIFPVALLVPFSVGMLSRHQSSGPVSEVA